MFSKTDKKLLRNPQYNLPLEKFYMSTTLPNDENYYYEKHGFNGTLKRAYPFSNENLDAIFAGRDLRGKSLLTVGSSGDQLLYGIFAGAAQVSLIDANIYSRAYVEYKLAAIQTLSFEEFNQAFNGQAFDWRIYQKISHQISGQTKEFWDSIFLNYDSGGYDARELHLDLMSQDFGDWECKSVFYRNPAAYELLQKLIPQCKIDYQVSSFYDFPQDIAGRQYDFIYLSNIRKYVAEEGYQQVVGQLYDKNLTQGGEMMVDYFFRDSWYTPGNRLVENVLKTFNVQAEIADGDVFYLIKKDSEQSCLQQEGGVPMYCDQDCVSNEACENNLSEEQNQ